MLEVASLHLFCGKRLLAFINGGKDVLHDTLKRQGINWREFLYEALQLIRKHNLGNEPFRAAFFDETIKHRSGKNVSTTSNDFDLTLD